MFGSTNMLILKVTRDCNLRCKYCYIKDKDNFKDEMISFDMYKTIIEKIITDKKSVPQGNFDFTIIFHGGEPLLMGRENFSRFLSYASRRFKEEGIRCGYGIQTNLTLINEDIMALMHQYNVTVGVSFDGIKESNSSRTAIDTDKFESQFKKMDEFGVNYGFLIVVNKANIENVMDSIDYVFEKYKIGKVKVNYAEDVNSEGDESEVTGEQFITKAWIPILDSFLSGKYKHIVENNLEEIITRYFATLMTGKATVETMKSNCGLKVCGGGMHIIEINPDGDVYFCGRYSEDFEEVFVQNVKDKEFLELKQISRYFSSVKTRHGLVSALDCDICEADNICDHGCMAFHYSKYGEFGIRDNLVCNIFKPLNKYIITHEKEIFERLYETNKNKDGIWYWNLKIDMRNASGQFMNKMKSMGYNIQLDSNFKTDGHSPVPQLQISRENSNDI